MSYSFTPIYGKENEINLLNINNGYIYFSTDTGRIYMDMNNERVSMGGSGIALFYTDQENVIKEDDENAILSSNYFLDSHTLPKVNDIIINSDGIFYKVKNIEGINYYCLIMAISGNGSGGSGPSVEKTLNFTYSGIKQNQNFIYGQDAEITVYGVAKEDDGFYLSFDLYDRTDMYNPIFLNGFKTDYIPNGSDYIFNLKDLFIGVGSKLSLSITIFSDNASSPVNKSINGLSVVEMGIEKDPDFSITAPIISTETSSLVIKYIPLGDSNSTIQEKLHVYIDSVELTLESNQQIIKPSWYNRSVSLTIPEQTHGLHLIELTISTEIDNQTIFSNKIVYEAAWVNVNEIMPVLWLGNYEDHIVEYDILKIPFLFYHPINDPMGLSTTIELYKGNEKISTLELTYNDEYLKTNGWFLFDVTNYYHVGKNNFSIKCENVVHDIEFTVIQSDIDLTLAEKNNLLMHFSTIGRSSSEVKNIRSIFKSDTQNIYYAKLNNFNWQNNGWQDDDDGNGSYLNIANGASVEIPVPPLILNNTTDYTFEMRLRTKNVQEYSILVREVETYFYKVLDPITGEFQKSESGDSRANIIKNFGPFEDWVWLDEWGSPEVDEENSVKEIQKDAGVACTWLNNNGQGFAIGTHEAYFTNQKNTGSLKFIEDEIVNISMVISKTDKAVYLYLNGILSGGFSLAKGATGNISINSNLIINSNYCDFDLFDFRVYSTGLTMPNIIHNYISDLRDVSIYNQNQLADDLDPTALSYEKLIEYNRTHPDEQTMPYAVFEIMQLDDQNRETLPYKKGDNRVCKVTFVNPAADRALELGEIDEQYYYTHSPSFESYGVDINVQGTSSQSYARRNFKTKFKDAATPPEDHPDYYWRYLKGSLAGQSLGKNLNIINKNNESYTVSSKFHMDNETCSTDKFTWKIDYMESSGTYNTGFANLMGNRKNAIYTKHPLDDLNINDITTKDLRTTVYGFPVLTFQKFANGTYEYIGRYNFNLDKGSNEYFGFKLKINHPYVLNKTIAKVAECWELKDNDGTWCSFRYPSQAAREAGFGATQTGYTDRLEVLRHFEYRYTDFGDQLDWIGPTGKYDGDPATTKQEIIDEVGQTDQQKSNYARNVYKNLERVFNWLDSTDTYKNITELNLTEPVTYITTIDYNEYTDDNGRLIEPGTISVYDPEQSVYTTTFNKDTAGYRLEKFRNEFNLHFDKEYCLKYFILTELLLCYDSRGKNMMLASFGPHELGGEYIWYPIFYDIDTQLGLNNSGFYLWDYDADVTKDDLFSTPNSVLWVNFYKAFYDEIKSTYSLLRAGSSTSSNVIKLTYNSILGAYQCDPTVFDSYAMKGLRPIIAIGLDSYYKYLAPSIASKGYYSTSGARLTQEPPYKVFQGDKKMSTAALLKNRLNYIDSWWQSGTYSVSETRDEAIFRFNANKPDKTSDKYLDVSETELLAINQDRINKFESKTYPVKYFDSVAALTIKPFLKQYMFIYQDENPTPSVKYEGGTSQKNGVEVLFDTGTQYSYKNNPSVPQQLYYIPSFDMISSLGDLSQAYPDQVTLKTGKKLLDFNLGSDIPGYRNQLLTNSTEVIFNDNEEMATKPLLQSMNLCNLTSFDQSIVLSGSKKLKEFRALNSAITNVELARGAPISILHLPKTITSLELVSTKNLTKILKNKPQIVYEDPEQEGTYIYYDKNNYNGLYLENITDFENNLVLQGTGHKINALVLEDTGLNYGSYIILRNLWDLKKTATNENELRASLKNVNWSPYEQVDTNTFYNQREEVPYYYLTAHNTFENYIDQGEEQWNIDVHSGYIYTYNNDLTTDSLIITDLSLLYDLIVNNYDKFNIIGENNKNIFTSITANNQASVPTITGELFVNNSRNEDAPINEFDLENIYKQYWPELKIYAAKINKCPVIKFIDFNEEDLEEHVIDIIKYDTFDQTYTQKIPSRLHKDFLGWSLSSDQDNLENIIISYDNETKQLTPTNVFNNLSFDNLEDKTLILYAIFTNHKYSIKFYNADNSLLQESLINAGTQLSNPNIYCDYNDNELAFNQRYRFAGWTTQITNAIMTSSINANRVLINLSDYYALQDYNFYTCYYPESVYKNETDGQYFDSEDYFDGCILSPKAGLTLKGKITIPAYHNTKPVLALKNFYNEQITHLFFSENSQVNIIAENCFKQNKYLQYIEFPSSLTTINASAFQEVFSLQSVIFKDNLVSIGDSAFAQSFSGTLKLKLPYALTHLGSSNKPAFEYLDSGNKKDLDGNAMTIILNELQLGEENKPFTMSLNNNAFITNRPWNNIIIYTTPEKINDYNSFLSNTDIKYINKNIIPTTLIS